MKNGFYSIAIDGPSGAGKSTLARKLAAALGFLYVDTGAIYRTVGVHALHCHVDTKDAGQVAALLPDIRIQMYYDGEGQQRMRLNGEDVSDEIRLPEASLAASDVSAIPAVRQFLLQMQRDMALQNNVLMDGRDIGTVVLPEADLKIFLTATVEERAGRRYNELVQRRVPVTYENVLAEMRLRDEQDTSRATAPLRAAPDAVLVDTTGYSFEESFERLKSIVRERLPIEIGNR